MRFIITGIRAFLIIFLSVYTGKSESVIGSIRGSDTISVKGQKQTVAPRITRPDTCPPPRIVRIPVSDGGYYVINYATGPEKIWLKRPSGKVLPLGREPLTGKLLSSPEAQGLAFLTTYTTDDGLALDGITDGLCDREGYLWICTAGGGVSRFDGKSFTNFTRSQGLVNNSVWSVAEDGNGNIWFGTQGGVSCYNGSYFKSYTVDDGLANNIVRSVCPDNAGNVWFGTNGGGVSKFDGKRFINYTSKDGLGYDYVYDITVDLTGSVWFCTVGGGVSVFDGKSFRTYTSKDGLAGDVAVSCCIDKSGKLWFGTYGGGVSVFNGKGFINYTQKDGLGANTIWRILQDNEGNIWLGTDGGGVTRFDGHSFMTITSAQGLPNNTVWCIIDDRSDNLWFGTFGGGISRYNGTSFINFTAAQGLANNIVRSIAEDKDGDLWFGTDLGGASRYDGKSITNFSIAQGLGNETVWAIGKDSKGNLWFGTAGGGVSKYDGSSFITYSTEQGLAHTIIRSIKEDRKKNMWFGSWTGGVSEFDGKTFTTYTTAQGLANNSVMDILEDHNGNLWFCTYGGGISRFDGKRFITISISDGLVNNDVKCAAEDKSGNLWIGTEGGISVFPALMLDKISETGSVPPGMFPKNMTVREGLPDNSVMKILMGSTGIIYAGTSRGIAEIVNTSDGRLTTGKIFSSATGYPVKDITSGFNSLFEDSRGIIWAATGSDRTAIVRFDPEALMTKSRTPELVIQGIKINNENVCWKLLDNKGIKTESDSLELLNEEYQTFGKVLSDSEAVTMKNKFSNISFSSIRKNNPVPEALVVPHSANNLSFEFNALVTGTHQMIRYSYILDGYNNYWSPESEKTSAVFGNIYEGNYTFRVKARILPGGNWSEPVVYRFRVLPPWYRRWSMYALYIIAILSSLYAFYRWRVARLKNENLVLEKKVRQRTSELEQANKQIEAQRDLVIKQKEKIEEIHKEVTDSIHYAKRLQTSALPPLKELEDNTSGLFLLFRPKDVVSGDFYWYARAGKKIIFTVADCTGHGVPGAFMSIMGISLLKEIVIKGQEMQPDKILNSLREEIIRALGQTGAQGEQKDGMDIALCSLDTETLLLQYSGANLACLIVRNGSLNEIKGDKMPVAVYEKMDSFTTKEFQLQSNDMIYLSGDGFHDQFGGPDNKKFMSRKFKDLLISVSSESVDDQQKALVDSLEKWQFGYGTTYPQTDDITVLGIRI